MRSGVGAVARDRYVACFRRYTSLEVRPSQVSESSPDNHLGRDPRGSADYSALSTGKEGS